MSRTWIPFGRPGTKDKWGNECSWPTKPGEYEYLEDMYYDWWKEGEIESEEELDDESTDVFDVEDIAGRGLYFSWLYQDDYSLHPIDLMEDGYWRRADER